VGQSRWFSKHKNFTADATITQNTLTVILDTNGEHSSAGFTPVKWESPPKRKYKSDYSEKSFLFHAEESAQHLGEEISGAGQKRSQRSNLMCFYMCGVHALVVVVT
jgi:hypothetical protein